MYRGVTAPQIQEIECYRDSGRSVIIPSYLLEITSSLTFVLIISLIFFILLPWFCFCFQLRTMDSLSRIFYIVLCSTLWNLFILLHVAIVPLFSSHMDSILLIESLLVILTTVDGHLCFFSFVTVMNNVSENILVRSRKNVVG